MNEKLITNRRIGLWVIAGLCGLLAAAFLVNQADAASKRIKTHHLPITLYVKGVDGFVGSVINLAQSHAEVYHEYFGVIIPIQYGANGGQIVSEPIGYESYNCTGQPFIMELEGSNRPIWVQWRAGFIYEGGQYRVFKAGGDSQRELVTIGSFESTSGDCSRVAQNDEYVGWAYAATATDQYISDGPYRLVPRSTKPGRPGYGID